MDLKIDEENVNTVENQREKIRTTIINIALSNHFFKKQRRQLNYLFRLTKPLELSRLYTTKPSLSSIFLSLLFLMKSSFWGKLTHFFKKDFQPKYAWADGWQLNTKDLGGVKGQKVFAP